MTQRLVLLSALSLLAVPAFAQSAVTSYEFRVYAVGAPAPTTRTPFPISEVTCNQAPPTVINPVNPARAVWDDPTNAGKVCIWAPAVSIFGQPIGAYEATLVAVDAAGVGAESNRAPFSRQAVQAARTGFKLAQ